METIEKSRKIVFLSLSLLLFSCGEKKVVKEAPVPQVVYEEALKISVQPKYATADKKS